MTPLPYLAGALVVLIVGVVVFRVVVRRDYRRLGRLTTLSTLLQYVAILAWVCFGWLNMPRGWPAVSVGVAQAAVGWLLFAGGWAVFFAAFMRLGFHRSHGAEPTSLHQAGLYALTRNPQIVGFLAAMVGYVVLWPTWRNAGVVALIVVLAEVMARTEEEHLRAVFGAEYERYCQRVPRYFRLRRRAAAAHGGS
jgi:protein-S-isoprenylcysteine O-methyltransferase Ste14